MADPFYNPVINFTSEDNQVSLSIHLDIKDETVWLTLNQISNLFQRDKSVISRHIKNVFRSKELERKSVVAKNATTATDGKNYNVEYFNLDVILAVGYRVNSQKGTEFRRWVSKILKDYLLKGYSLNKSHLLNSGLGEIDRSLELLKQSLLIQGHISQVGSAAIEIIQSYTKSWLLLNAFDENRLPYVQKGQNTDILFTYDMAQKGVFDLKSTLMKQKEATPFFGNEREEGLQQIIGSIHQTFDGTPLYPSVYERAAHLFYFTIKDHPFTDGNKRIGSFFLLFYLSTYSVDLHLTNEALIALALFVAQSQPCDKEIVIKLILNLIVKD